MVHKSGIEDRGVKLDGTGRSKVAHAVGEIAARNPEPFVPDPSAQHEGRERGPLSLCERANRFKHTGSYQWRLPDLAEDPASRRIQNSWIV